MNRLSIIFAILSIIFLSQSLYADNFTAKEIAYKIFHREIGWNSISESQMVLIDSRGKKRLRDFTLKRYKENNLERSLIRFYSPADIEGTGFLTMEKEGWKTEQFLFEPDQRRAKRIITSQKDQKFVNSDFTYEEMERHPVENYEYQLKGSAKVNNLDCYILESIPKKEAESQYSKTLTLVHKDSFTPILTKFFDKNNNFQKLYKVLNLNKVQGIWTEMIVSMENKKKNHKTFIKTKKIVYNSTLFKKDDLSRKKLEIY